MRLGATYLVVCNQAVAPGDVDRITATGAKAADEVLPVGQTCKPLFPQELQSPQGLFARPRMLHPICHTLPHFGIYLLVVFGQNYFHSLSVFIAAANLEIIFVTTKNPIKNLSKSAFFCFYFRLYVYSIGRIMLSIKAISSAVRLYLA